MDSEIYKIIYDFDGAGMSDFSDVNKELIQVQVNNIKLNKSSETNNVQKADTLTSAINNSSIVGAMAASRSAEQLNSIATRVETKKVTEYKWKTKTVESPADASNYESALSKNYSQIYELQEELDHAHSQIKIDLEEIKRKESELTQVKSVAKSMSDRIRSDMHTIIEKDAVIKSLRLQLQSKVNLTISKPGMATAAQMKLGFVGDVLSQSIYNQRMG